MPTLAQSKYLELLKARNELEKRKEDDYIQPFAEQFGKNLIILLGYEIPIKETWPRWVQSAFDEAKKNNPGGANLWMRRVIEGIVRK